MPEQSDELVALRGTKSVFQRYVGNKEREILHLIENMNINDDEKVMDDNITELNALKQSFSDKVEEIKETNSKINLLLSPEARDKELESNLKWEESIYRTFARIDRCLSKISKAESVNIANSSTSTNINRGVINIKLPKLELPKFNGDIKQWQGFWDQFNTSVNENNSISDIEKFNYLRTFLTGPAYTLISGLTLSSENYKEAVNILTDRYGNKQTLIFSYMDSFVQLSPVKESSDVKNLRIFYDSIEIGVRNLDALNVKTNSYGTLLISLINSKLPEDLRLHLSRKFKNNLWNIDELLSLLKTDIEAKERLFNNTESINKENQINRRKVTHGGFTSQNLFNESGNHNRYYEQKQCPFCELNNHSPLRCMKVTDVDQRKSILIKKGLCFLCFGNHLAFQCTSKYRCKKCDKGKHHISICSFDKKENNKNETSNNFSSSKNNILLQTAFVEAKSPDHSKKTTSHVLFDTGSQRTYISEKLRNELNLPTLRKENLKIKTFGGNNFKTECVDIVSLILVSNEKLVNIEAICYPMICSTLYNQDILCAVEQYEHLKGLNLADNLQHEHKEIDLLIGLDFYFECVTGVLIKGNSKEPMAISSIFGWIIFGHFEGKNSAYTNVCHLLRVNTETYFQSEINVKAIEDAETGNCNEKIYSEFRENINFHDNRYCVKLPFKDEVDIIPDNYSMALNRLKGLKIRLSKNEELLNNYKAVIDDYLSQGIVETVNPVTENYKVGTVHYLPHQAVIKPERETTKLRVVFDAAAKSAKELSLNEVLEPGPCLLPRLYDMLIRFRVGKFAIVADIKQAFHQICLHKEHRDFTRFLWFSDIRTETPEVIVLRFARLVFGLTSSPFLLNATIQHHLQKYLHDENITKIIKQLMKNLYVDDVVSSFHSKDDCVNFYRVSSSVLKDAKFELRKWMSNNGDIRNIIDAENSLSSNDVNKKVLGLNWDINNDLITYDFNDIVELWNTIPATKRNVLRIQNMFYDPIGLISPISLPFKIIFQKLCKQKFDWDTLVPDQHIKLINNHIKGLKNIKTISVSRHVLCCVASDVQLHGFCDSSGSAYCAVVYARVSCCHGVKVRLWSSKTRILSKEGYTIPRLELMGCVLLAKLIRDVMNALVGAVLVEKMKIFCWSDSMVALWWIKQTEKVWKTWVQNRVAVIRSLVGPENWYHVSTEENPADVATRMLSPQLFLRKDVWWKGPLFLMYDEVNWPKQNFSLNEKDAKFTEYHSESSLMVGVVDGCVIKVGKAVSCERFGKLLKLLRVTAYVYRFVGNMLACVGRGVKKSGEIGLDEVEEAKRCWIKWEQAEIKKEKHYEKMKFSLNLFEDNDKILRLKSRISENTDIGYNSKFPILLHRETHFTKLVICYYHEVALHSGTEMTLNLLRNEFWIIKGRKTVKSVLRECIICKYVYSKPAKETVTANLPQYRVNFTQAFQVVGIDYAGPLLVKDVYSKKKNVNKCFLLLITCTFSRAIHLELTSNLSAENLVLALKRFISRRSKPSKIISDNAKTFKSKTLKEFTRNNNIDWQFILQRAPWWGGFYERMIGVVKSSLKKVLKRALLNFEELNTVIIQIENIVNSRPLTYLSEEEYVESLTPNHLVYGRNIVNCDSNYATKNEIDNEADCRKVYKHRIQVIEHFKKRFYCEYLNALKERHIYQRKTDNRETNANVGDIVVIKEQLKPRQMWKKGRITELVQGRDGITRGVKVEVINNQGVKTELRRPLSLIYPLEIVDSKEPTNTQRTRPQRESAKNADLIRKLTTK